MTFFFLTVFKLDTNSISVVAWQASAMRWPVLVSREARVWGRASVLEDMRVTKRSPPLGVSPYHVDVAFGLEGGQLDLWWGSCWSIIWGHKAPPVNQTEGRGGEGGAEVRLYKAATWNYTLLDTGITPSSVQQTTIHTVERRSSKRWAWLSVPFHRAIGWRSD